MTRFRVVLTLLGATAMSPTALFSGVCGNNDPAIPVPECRNQNDGQEADCADAGAVRMWPAGLRPGRPNQTLPEERDSTQWTSTSIPGHFSGHELFHGLDIVGTKLFVAYNAGFQVWDIAGSNADNPSREHVKDGWRGDFLDFAHFGENDFYIDDIDVVASGGRHLIALSGRDSVGVTIWEYTISPPRVEQKYQDLGNRSERVRVVNQGGTNYVFAGGQFGIFVYDMDAAMDLTSPCLDDDGTACSGVWQGRLGETNLSLFLDVIKRDGNVYVAKSGGNGVPVEIWEVTTPSNPGTAVRRFQGLSEGGQGLAFFEVNTIPYLAVVEKSGNTWRLKIYNVDSCLDTNGCGSLGSPLINRSTRAAASSPQFLTYSKSGSTPFLYYGLNEFGLEGNRVEQLLDLSNFPFSVSEITASGGEYTDTCNGLEIDYWGDYYPHNLNGLRNTRPMVGKFSGDYFYRAAFGILDVHVREDQDPTLILSGPAQGFLGEPQEFTVTASACNPSPPYDWNATGGGTVSGVGATVNVTWTTPGTKTVTVTNESDCPGALGAATIVIEDPAAMVGGVSLDPAAPRVCEDILFTADDVTGKPPISDAWTITRNQDDVVVASGGGPGFTFSWDTSGTPTPLPGNYTAEVTVSNAEGMDTAQTVFNLAAASLEFVNGVGPTYEGAPSSPNIGVPVQFLAAASGDSSWSWNFGDPDSGGANTSNLENPVHTFGAVGTYTVTLTIESCDPGVPPIQGTLMVEVIDNPLDITFFSAVCSFGVCEFCTGEPVGFLTQYEGVPEDFSYDWDGDGDFDSTAAEPINSRVYNTPLENFFPRARIRAGGQQDIFTQTAAMRIVDCGPPPSPVVDVNGPTTREVGQTGNYSASAINCSPSASGWTWTASGGGILTGNTSSDQVSIRWTSTGTKSVTARNSSCGSATGSHTVIVTGPEITISGPSTRLVGQSGSFTASASNCSPVASGWSWTATGGAITGSTESNAVSISWSSPGTKTVTAANTGCSGALGTRSVAVSSSGGGVNAAFTYSPANPQMREAVEFDGRSSTGNIGTYFWSFGDGGSGLGATAIHTFESEGSYTVSLTVAEPGCANPQCEDTATRTVVVGGDEPPPPADGERLILPFFVVDTGANPGSGLTTFFSVRNATDFPVMIRTDYFGVDDSEPFFSEEKTLAPHSTKPTDVRLIADLPADFETGLATGFVQVTAIGSEAEGRSISGDVYIVDAPNDFASGSNLLTTSSPDLCSRWGTRFFDGGAFDGGTELQFYAPGNPGDGSAAVVGNVYDQEGQFMKSIELFNPEIAFRVDIGDLEAGTNFGAIEWQFQHGIRGHLAVVLKALGRFSVGGPAICQDAF